LNWACHIRATHLETCNELGVGCVGTNDLGVGSLLWCKESSIVSNDHDAHQWLARAKEARNVAGHMTQPAAKREMLLIAAAYFRLAQQRRAN
jgi:hypothetical protein